MNDNLYNLVWYTYANTQGETHVIPTDGVTLEKFEGHIADQKCFCQPTASEVDFNTWTHNLEAKL